MIVGLQEDVWLSCFERMKDNVSDIYANNMINCIYRNYLYLFNCNIHLKLYFHYYMVVLLLLL